jgi:hypothetical protein
VAFGAVLINVRITAVRKLGVEAADNGCWSVKVAAKRALPVEKSDQVTIGSPREISTAQRATSV